MPSRLDDLQELRDKLREWVWVEEAPADRKAALVGQYRATLAEIDELSPKEETGDAIDEIAARRAARRARPAARANRTKRTG